jgi:uncharacterized membrane protein
VTFSTDKPTGVRPDSEGAGEGGGSGDSGGSGTAADSHPGRPRAWWRRPWLGLLTVIVLFYLAVFVLPPYLTLDPAQARIDLNEGLSWHYPVLVVHVATGSIAMLAGLLQIWPRLRRTRPRLHRVSGRVYVAVVLAGAPALAVLIVLRAQNMGDAHTSIVIGFSILTILWVWTTAGALRAARQGRYADHRRLMIYSFALTLSIMWSRFWFVAAMMIPGFEVEWVADNTGWLPWVLNLLIAQWWLNRTARRPLDLPASVSRSSR